MFLWDAIRPGWGGCSFCVGAQSLYQRIRGFLRRNCFLPPIPLPLRNCSKKVFPSLMGYAGAWGAGAGLCEATEQSLGLEKGLSRETLPSAEILPLLGMRGTKNTD